MPCAGSWLQLFSITSGILAVHAAICGGQPPPPVPAATTPAGPTVPSQDVLTQGPLHEAFAEPVNLSGAVPPIVPRRPPQPIEEAPAGYRPQAEGRDVDPRLLELGRRGTRAAGRGRFHLDQRDLAEPAAGPAVGRRLLDPGRGRLPVDARLLGARGYERGPVLSSAPGSR